MTKPLSNSQMRDAEALLHPYANAVALRETGVQIIERGEGVRVYDQTGRSYIEGLSGLWCAGLGFGNAELIETARQQMEKLPYYHLFTGKSHEPAVELAEKIKALAPGMTRVFYQSSGSEANETQVKMAWYYNNARGRPEKKKIVSRRKAYHGVTIVSASLTGLANNHRDFDLPVDRIRHTATPHFWREAEPGESEEAFVARLAAALDALVETEGPETVAAFIAEPVMGAGGVIVPPKGYFPAMAEVCRKHEMLMISDEVICGFARTGEWFGCQALGYQPTSMSMAKQLTGSYFPLSAVAIDRDMAETIEANSGRIGTFGHGFTYGGHPVGCAVGVKALEIYERIDAPARVRALAPRFAAHLDRLAQHPLVGEARHLGLIGALELSPDKSPRGFAETGRVAARAAAELLQRGVITRAILDSLAFCPPMIITEDELDEMFAPMEAALDATLDWAKAEGCLV
ncbi:aminotransferase [Amaricoccus sp.]|uniref:aminotransferase n=1 Tax=Amaricoccus sp. TaxID=1872485 RepID=UPI001B44DB92|nr:aminotransferase [Amaricoccus sp.]MBP7000522.1 aminotransferase class III-fold pyridoxal phosphate-dependent enzyme [Amaricoccus sp.]